MKLLKFYAEWCQPCHMLSKKMQSWPDSITNIVENIDVDDSKQRATVLKYNVRGIPLIILVDDNGNELQRFSSPSARTDLLGDIKEYVNEE